MLNRRTLLKAATFSPILNLLRTRNALATLTGAIPGCIRWDAWDTQSGYARLSQNSLGPVQWQPRAPWYCTIDSPYHVTCSSTQANMDMQIQLAAQAGYKYWAFDWYGAAPNGHNGPQGLPELNAALTFYNASTYKSLLNFCIISGASMFGATTSFTGNDWQYQVNYWVSIYQQSNYQKVLGNRPLVYILWNDAEVSGWFSNNIANIATALAYLRTQCVAAGLGSPYIALMHGTGSYAATEIAAIGADACALYTSGLSIAAVPDTAASLDAQTQATWAQQATSGYPIIPVVQHGWDTRPRRQNVLANTGYRPYLNMRSYFTPGTPAQIAAQYTEALAYIAANPSIVPTKALLAYSWTECDEGGGAGIPTLGDPPVNAESGQALTTSNLLKAIGPVLRASA